MLASKKERKEVRNLSLADLELQQLPGDLRTYSNLKDLDLSQNCLHCIAPGALPLSLTRLTLTHNHFVDLPALAALPSLKWLSANANRLAGIGDLFACPMLQHAGLGYNRLAALAAPAAPPAPAPALVSLDVSHNALCALAPLLGALRSGLPNLRVLSLLGNPLALREAYRARVLAGLPDLLFLDGVDLRQPRAATPPPDPTPAPARGRKAGAGRAAAQPPGTPAAAPQPGTTADTSPELEAPSVGICLQVSGLKLAEALLTGPPAGQSWRAARVLASQAAGAGGEPGAGSGKSPSAASAALSAAAGSNNPGLAPKPGAASSHAAAAAAAAGPRANAAEAAHAGPLEPDQAREAAAWRCHVEVAGPGGERAASLPLLVGAAAAPAEVSKGKAAGGRAGKAVQQAGKGADGGARPAAERAQGGCLAATWRAPVAVATRDWLRAGIGLDLMGTTLEADVPGAAEGLKACKVGTARFAAAMTLLDGVTREVSGTVCFAAPPAQCDSAGRRLTLVEALASAPQARL